jgi:hypothetical protein
VVGHSGTTQAPFLVQTNWAQFRFAQRHRGLNPFENVLAAGTVGGLNQDWTATTRGNIFSSPAVANGVVYVGSADNSLYTYDLSNPPHAAARPSPTSLVPDLRWLTPHDGAGVN